MGLVCVSHLVSFLLVFFDLLLDLALVSYRPLVPLDFIFLLLLLLEFLVNQRLHHLLLPLFMDFSLLVVLALKIGILIFSELFLDCSLVFLVLFAAAVHQLIDQGFLLLAVHRVVQHFFLSSFTIVSHLVLELLPVLFLLV